MTPQKLDGGEYLTVAEAVEVMGCTEGWVRTLLGAGRIPGDGFLLLSSVPYEDIGVDRARAVLKSRFLARFAADVIRREFADLAPKMSVRTSVLHWQQRALEPLADDAPWDR